MRTQNVVREGLVAAVDTPTKLEYFIGSTTVQDIKVPNWAHSIKYAAVGMGVDGAAGSGCVLLTIKGGDQGDQILAMGAYTNIGTTVALAQKAMEREVDIPVTPGKDIELWITLCGDDTGSPELQAEIQFNDAPGNHAYVTRQADLATVDVWQELNTENGSTAKNSPSVQGVAIEQVWGVVGLKPTTQEPHQVMMRIVGVQGSIEGNEHDFVTSSNLVSDGTLADAALDGGVVKNVSIGVTQGTFRMEGVDSSASSTADPMLAMTTVFRLK